MLPLVASALLGACGGSTSVIVVVDSDLDIPEELALVRVVVQNEIVTDFVLDGETPQAIPFSFTIVPLRDEANRPLTLYAEGRNAVREREVEIEVDTAFAQGESIMLPLRLDRRCRTESCDQTIDASALERVEPGEEL